MHAIIPEHSIAFMEVMSGGKAFTEQDYIFLAADDWLMAIGYPLHPPALPSSEVTGTFENALKVALARTRATDCWAIAPHLPATLKAHECETDEYYTLPVTMPVPASLRGPLVHAADVLHVEESRIFTAAHRRLWAEFMGRTALKAAVRELFARTETLITADLPHLTLLNAWDTQGNLAASLVLDFAPDTFCSYIIGAHSRAHYTPHASDLLFATMLEKARERGKTFVHLGLGVNDGIRRFKTKWGGKPLLPYAMATWNETPTPAPREAVDEFMRALLSTPSDQSKRQYMAALPEQRPFAMLWELEKNGRRSWIGGAAHFFCYSFEASFRHMFEQADTILFEGPLDPESLNLVERHGRSPLPRDQAPRVIDEFSEAQLVALERVVRGPTGPVARFFNAATPNPANVRHLLTETRPWFAFFSLWTAFLERKGWSQSVDLEAWNLARNMGKTIIGIESLEEQIASLEAAPLKRITHFLQHAHQWPAYVRRNIRTYLQGDLDGMMGSSAEFPTRTEQIIDQRDERFRQRMRPFIEEGRAVVFVGAAHMRNLRHMLREDGFSVRRVLPTWKHKMRALLQEKWQNPPRTPGDSL